MVLESEGFGVLIELEAHGHVFRIEIAVAPREHHHAIDEEGQQEINQHTSNHDEESLPGWLGAEFPWLWGTAHLLCVEALVDHACNLAIAAQGKPACTILCVAVLGFELENRSIPFADAYVEEHIEFLNAYAKEFGEEEVASLMQQHKERNGQNEL